MKRAWGIRHIRYFWLKARCVANAARWASMGIGLGYIPESDWEYLELVWAGSEP